MYHVNLTRLDHGNQDFYKGKKSDHHFVN
uniref:Uncharacterized protein n=1 Tax=Anguilla anguilla TaxID=7936 RepID=A0A0E9T496_ANGAN